MRLLLVLSFCLFCSTSFAECKDGRCSVRTVTKSTVKTVRKVTAPCKNGKCGVRY